MQGSGPALRRLILTGPSVSYAGPHAVVRVALHDSVVLHRSGVSFPPDEQSMLPLSSLPA